MLQIAVPRCLQCSHTLTTLPVWRARRTGIYLQHYYCKDSRKLQEENKHTLDQLYNLSVDVQKIRRLKAWVLLREKTYVEENASILKDMGANATAVASILERCPEAILQSPEEINAQKSLWRSVHPSDIELIKIIERFPESFFSFTQNENQMSNIQYFLELGIRKKIVSRFLATAPDIFCKPVENNKQLIVALQESYIKLGGSEANMKIWLIKLLCQDPFILSKATEAVKNNLDFLQRLGFRDFEVLKLLSKLKGFIFDLTCSNMESSVAYTKQIFNSSNEELKEMIMNCPAVLYYPVEVLQERIERIVKAGILMDQIKEFPSVLELTTQIVQFRIKKLVDLGYDIKHLNLEHLSGTKKDFEVNFNKIQTKRERPLFNPVVPLTVDD
ncbi:transcription termination factor 2, mitochondrial [Ambystoma mexicanum]|uniref:transcription termination factor 2, mitochondrial n=1 Tax=Ambystoma mexicanum TaxID=8296 RepID=UPI0037E86616